MSMRRQNRDSFQGARPDSVLKTVEYDGDAANPEVAVTIEAQVIIHMQTNRKDVFDTNEKQGQSGLVGRMSAFPIKKKKKHTEEQKIVLQALRDNIVLNDNLSDTQLNFLVEGMRPKDFEEGQDIYKENESSASFFVVRTGRVEFTKEGDYCGECNVGDSFGELGLVYNSKRDVTATATEHSEVWILDATTYRAVLREKNFIARIRNGLIESDLFTGLLDRKTADEVAQKCTLCKFNAKDVVVIKGDVGHIAYFVLSGQLNCTRLGERSKLVDVEVNPGDYFGVSSLMGTGIRAANVIAVEPTECIAMEKKTLNELVIAIPKLRPRLATYAKLRRLRSVPLLNELRQEEILDLLKKGVSRYLVVDKGTRIVSQGKEIKYFFIILEGGVKIVQRAPAEKATKSSNKGTKVDELFNGDYFGEKSLISDDAFGANGDIVASSHTVLFAISKGHIKELRPLTNTLKRGLVSKIPSGLSENIQLKDLIQIKTLGAGSYGRVKLVEHKKTKKTYALKIIQKAKVMRHNQHQHVIAEKTIMYEAKHPFILRLISTFQTKNAIYMLTELILGGELFNYLTSQGHTINNNEARFYIACLVEAISYLHEKQFIYRDLKPENVMIDVEGYVRLIDFGMVKKMKNKAAKTYTHCGTTEYMAPEIIRATGHNRGVDYWAIGVILYEMLTGGTPFHARREAEVYKKVLGLQYKLPATFPKHAGDLVKRLLVDDTNQRLGMLQGGTNDIKKHIWFMSIDWKELYNKNVEPPWIPKVTSPKDTGNFKEWDEDDTEMEYNGIGFKNW